MVKVRCLKCGNSENFNVVETVYDSLEVRDGKVYLKFNMEAYSGYHSVVCMECGENEKNIEGAEELLKAINSGEYEDVW